MVDKVIKNTDYWLALIEKHWDDIGACGSCGWHALLSEHQIDDIDIQDALNDNGDMELSCQNDDYESYDHRGVRFNLYELEKS